MKRCKYVNFLVKGAKQKKFLTVYACSYVQTLPPSTMLIAIDFEI